MRQNHQAELYVDLIVLSLAEPLESVIVFNVHKDSFGFNRTVASMIRYYCFQFHHTFNFR